MRAAAIFVIFGMVVSASAAFGQEQPIACAETTNASQPAQAFEAFCGRCHQAQALAAGYFAGTSGDSARRREGELAAFLNRHSGCPHRHHEEIAAWLRELSSGQ